jgi:hypothetical protein
MKEQFFALFVLMFFAGILLFAIGFISMAAYNIHPMITVMILFTTLVVSITTPMFTNVKVIKINKRG